MFKTHELRDFMQSPRYRDRIHPAPHATTNTAWEAGRDAPSTTCRHTKPGGKSRKSVASEARIESQGFALLAALVVAFALLLTGTAHAKCRTHRCFQRVHEKHVARWLRAHRPWIYAWRHLTARERAWAHCIAHYETRGYAWSVKARVATGNGYYGATQWLPATWHDAGGSGLPTEHTLHEQLVRTVRWAHVAGSSQWSTSRYCGSV